MSLGDIIGYLLVDFEELIVEELIALRGQLLIDLTDLQVIRVAPCPDVWVQLARLCVPFCLPIPGAFDAPTLACLLGALRGAELSGLTLLATVYFQLFADESHKEWVNMPLDAHVVMGGALSFLYLVPEGDIFVSALSPALGPASRGTNITVAGHHFAAVPGAVPLFCST